MGSVGGRLAIALCALFSTVAGAQTYPFRNPDLPVDQRIGNLLSLMTADEKIDALSTNSGVPRLGVPSFGSSEGIHGLQQRGSEERQRAPIPTTQFPQPPGMGESWDPDLVRQAGGVQGYEARYITQTPAYDRRILMLWGPQADLARDPRWGRSEEVYGEDAWFNGVMATAFAKGLEGDDPKYWQHPCSSISSPIRTRMTGRAPAPISTTACSGNIIRSPSAWPSRMPARAA